MAPFFASLSLGAALARPLFHDGPISLPGTILILIFFAVSVVAMGLALRLKRQPEYQFADKDEGDGPGDGAQRSGTQAASPIQLTNLSKEVV